MRATPGSPSVPPARRPSARRTTVVRSDGRRVRVPRLRGQLFVCALGCCCGRTEGGRPAVPGDVYHAEWERRGLRDVVHLTIGGCLGPCALANVALLVLDGEPLWLHSMNEAAAVLALYDYLEARLRDGRGAALPPALARRRFTAFDWEPGGPATPPRGGAPERPRES